MAEGGQLAWKRQVIDESRGPAADYSSLRKPLPAPPSNVEWKLDGKEWRLVRKDTDDIKRKFDLNICETWNPNTGRTQASIVPVPKEEEQDDETRTHNTNDNNNNNEEKPPNEPVENVDYVVHTVLPSDTLAGLCLRYKVKATLLRQVNKFSGSNLLLAPSKLVIPLNEDTLHLITVQDKTTRDYKLQSVVAEYPHLRQTEARAYLEMNDWDLDEALKSVQEDEAWEREQEKKDKKKNKPLLNVHVAVPAEEVLVENVKTSKEEEEKGLLEPLLSEVELTPTGRRYLC